MLRALDAARDETEAALARQREFVADASHELRTPLTSVLANLELLADTLDGEQGEAAAVGAALLAADAPARRRPAAARARRRRPRGAAPARSTSAQVVVEAAAELGRVAGDHELHVDVAPVTVSTACATTCTASR